MRARERAGGRNAQGEGGHVAAGASEVVAFVGHMLTDEATERWEKSVGPEENGQGGKEQCLVRATVPDVIRLNLFPSTVHTPTVFCHQSFTVPSFFFNTTEHLRAFIGNPFLSPTWRSELAKTKGP